MAEKNAVLERVLRVLDDMKALDVWSLDVSGRSSITEYMVVATGTSNRHVRSIAEEVMEASKKAGVRPLGMEGEQEGQWVLVDLDEVVLHVMQPTARAFYSLEKLWDVEPQDGEPMATPLG